MTDPELIEELTALRRDIHRHPEPGFEEVRTQAIVRGQLEAVGLEPRPCAKTGLIVDIGSGPRTIALRADLDCLRMAEANESLAYRSQRDGLAHMCGHDGHTAVLVGVGRALAARRNSLPGRVRLLFQPAEEGPGGASVMIEDGALDGVDEIYGMHNWPGAPLGSLRTIAGPCMATVGKFTIAVRGRGGHASQPQDCIDPIVTAAHIVTTLQTVVSRHVHYEERVVVSVTKMSGGEAFNVIPDEVELCGTVRALSDHAFDLVRERMRDIVEMTAKAAGAEASLDMEQMYPVLINTDEHTAHVLRLATEQFGADNVSAAQLPMLGAEDFSYFLHHRPGCYFFLGTHELGRSNALCHATTFDFNDNVIEPALQFWLRVVDDRLLA